MPGAPSVAVVVPSWNGVQHLRPCLESLAGLAYEPLEVVVVDNGSTDGTREVLAAESPRARVVAFDRNLGFAKAVNAAARSSDADCVALLNNDMRVARDWLGALVDAWDPSTCVAGVILDWEGAHVQFAGGIVNFHGAAAQVPFGAPLEEATVQDGVELPFACGGSMLIDRRLFLELGGFDEDYFAYFEDVDLGWRLRLAGYSSRLAAGSRCYHRHHATGSTLALAERLRRYEANWLRTLLKNVSDEHLPRLLAAALLLVPERARAERDPALRRARLAAVEDVVAATPAILERRRSVQSLRRRSDDEVFATFGRPFFPAVDDDAYLDALERVVETLGLERLFPLGPRIAEERKLIEGIRGSSLRRAARRVRVFLRRS